MKIIEQYTHNAREVYAIYRSFYRGRVQTYYCIIPEGGCPGLLSIPESECEIVDDTINNLIKVKGPNRKDMLMHPIISRNSLYEGLIEHDQKAMKTFLELLSEYNKK